MSGQEIAALLHLRGGVRPTQQRIEVYRYLMDHPIHPSADTIYQALSAEYPSFPVQLALHNSLRSLTKAGLVRPVLIEPEGSGLMGSRRSWAFQVPALRGDIRFSIGSRSC